MVDKNELNIENAEDANDLVPEVTHDQGELAELHTKVEDLNDQLLRALAENQNLRRRLHKEIVYRPLMSRPLSS